MQENNQCFYENGLRFECQRCSACCGHAPGFCYLSRRDFLRLCDFFGMKPKEFFDEFCRLVGYYYGSTVVALKEKKNYDCILWNEGCTAYEACPIQCSTYPFWTWMVEDEKMGKECSADWPGMNKGKLHEKSEIENSCRVYDSNKPLTKEELEEILNVEKGHF